MPGQGTVDVRVSTPAGTSAAVPAGQFTYLHVSNVGPSPSGFGQTVLAIVTGGGFTPDSTVIFTAVVPGNPSPVIGTNVVFVDSGTLRVGFPGGPSHVPGGTGYTVTVRTAFGTSAPGPTRFIYSGISHS